MQRFTASEASVLQSPVSEPGSGEGKPALIRLHRLVEDALGHVRRLHKGQITIGLALEDVGSIWGNSATLERAVRSLTLQTVQRLKDCGGTLKIYLTAAFHDSAQALPPFAELSIIADATDDAPGGDASLEFAPVDGGAPGEPFLDEAAIVGKLGGSLNWCSRPSGAPCFKLRLPLHQPQGCPAQHLEGIPNPLAARVLLIDDEDAMVDMLSMMMRRIGCEVFSFTSPHAALEVLAAAPRNFDVMIVDYNMPGLCGARTAERAWFISPRLPIVLISGDKNVLERIDHRNRFSAFWIKPFSIFDTASQLREIFARAGKPLTQEQLI